MIKKINYSILKELSKHSKKISKKRILQSFGYERCGELPWIVEKLNPFFGEKMNYLDIGSGTSILPSYLIKKTDWDITCVDKFSWLQSQNNFANKVTKYDLNNRLNLIEKDINNLNLPLESFDIITNISVVEHFEGSTDSEMMEKTASLLKPGGIYILTTLINEKYFKEFYIKKSVYGEKYEKDPVFFQRHYDLDSIKDRLVKPSGLKEKERIFLGEYDFQFCEKFMILPWPIKPIKLFYQWATPFFAEKFLSYRDYPVSRPDMHMYTSSCICMILIK